jgi:hypothetical protein
VSRATPGGNVLERSRSWPVVGRHQRREKPTELIPRDRVSILQHRRGHDPDARGATDLRLRGCGPPRG